MSSLSFAYPEFEMPIDIQFEMSKRQVVIWDWSQGERLRLYIGLDHHTSGS